VVRAGAAALLLLGTPAPALAHGGAAHGTAGLDPWVALPLALSALALLAGAQRLARQGRTGAPLLRRGLLFAAGLGAIAVALLSPLEDAAQASFAAHMAEHELLMVAAAPLLVLARPLGIWLWALPRAARRAVGRALRRPRLVRSWRVLSAPATASGLQVVALWGWHVPALFAAALESAALHRLQHLCFLAAALLFWWSMLVRGRAGYGMAALHLFIASVHSGLLGALFLFAPQPWLRAHAASPSPLGLTALEDQQLAGIVMAGVACLVYPAVALRLLQLWIGTRRRRRQGAADALQPA
jgi:cytochrome c oxidase assembly factor CtaG